MQFPKMIFIQLNFRISKCTNTKDSISIGRMVRDFCYQNRLKAAYELISKFMMGTKIRWNSNRNLDRINDFVVKVC